MLQAIDIFPITFNSLQMFRFIAPITQTCLIATAIYPVLHQSVVTVFVLYSLKMFNAELSQFCCNIEEIRDVKKVQSILKGFHQKFHNLVKIVNSVNETYCHLCTLSFSHSILTHLINLAVVWKGTRTSEFDASMYSLVFYIVNFEFFTMVLAVPSVLLYKEVIFK